MEDPADVALLVRFLRGLRDWTQTDLAEAAGLDASSICRYEGGQTMPRRKTLERIAAAVDIPMSLVDACFLPAMGVARAASALDADAFFADLEKPTAELGDAAAGTVRAAAAAFLATLEASDQDSSRHAVDAWERLEPCTSEEAQFLIETCPEFQTWALAERLYRESIARPERAQELAELAVQVARRAPNPPSSPASGEGVGG